MTTHEKPFVVFTERERPARESSSSLSASKWPSGRKPQSIDGHYIQFKGKAYSIPYAYVGKKVWIRATEHLLQAFFLLQLIKQHVITRELPPYGFLKTSFENVRAVLYTGNNYRVLLERAEQIGPHFHTLVGGLRGSACLPRTSAGRRASSPRLALPLTHPR